jgi:hypothetical protein
MNPGNPGPMDVDALVFDILWRAAQEGLPDQIGPDHTLDEIAIYSELVDAGYLRGHVSRGNMGEPINVGGARITAFGRQYLNELQEVKRAKTVSGRVAKLAPGAIKWLFAVVGTIVGGIIGALLMRKFGLSK